MGGDTTFVGSFAIDETPTAVGSTGTRLSARRSGNAGGESLVVQIHRHDGNDAFVGTDQDGAAVSARYFLLLIDASETAD